MSLSVPTSPNNHQEVSYSTADFPPNFWAGSFLTFTPDDTVNHESKKQEIEEMKKDVRKELKACANDSPELLKLIDSIQLLGFAYHFEWEIEEALIDDSHGMLALYEASYLMIDGEGILEEALAFTTTRLQSMATDPNNPLAKQAIHALKRPIRKALRRMEARHYISIYQEKGSSCNKS